MGRNRVSAARGRQPSERRRDRKPGVVAIPPLIYLAALALGVVLDTAWRAALLPAPAQYALGFTLIAAGMAIVPFVLPHYRRAGTPFDVRRPAGALVTVGAHRFSRNPGYLAMTLAYAGIAFAADNFWMLVLLPPLLLVMHLGVIMREERHLESRFGDDFRRYRSQVRRWL